MSDLREQIDKTLDELLTDRNVTRGLCSDATDAVWAVVQPALDAKDTDRERLYGMVQAVTERNMELLQRAEQAEAERDRLREQLAELLDYKRYGTDCRHNAHVSMTAFAQKISEKRNAIAQRAEAVDHARALEAAIERVAALHRQASHGDVCVHCASDQRNGYDATWPCDTIRALDQPKDTP